MFCNTVQKEKNRKVGFSSRQCDRDFLIKNHGVYEGILSLQVFDWNKPELEVKLIQMKESAESSFLHVYQVYGQILTYTKA